MYIIILLYCQENISGVPAFLLLLDHFHFFGKVKEQLMQTIDNSPSASSMTSYQNVSTSCSTLATDIEYAYESINTNNTDGISSEGSTAAVSSKSAIESDGHSAGGSSSECLLLSSLDSLNSEHAQISHAFQRFFFDFNIPRKTFASSCPRFFIVYLLYCHMFKAITKLSTPNFIVRFHSSFCALMATSSCLL